MKKKLAAALLAIAMLAASLAGCSSPSSSQPAGSTSSSASTAESGEKVLTIAQGGDITTFDMQNHNNGVTGAVQAAMAKGVKVYYNEDGTVSIELHIIVENGVNLVAVCRSIMSEVRYVVSKTTGVEVRSVDVFVDSMRF